MKALNPQTAKHSSWAYAEQHAQEDAVLLGARERASDLGLTPVSEGTASALTTLAAATGARALVEVGTGSGVSGIALLRGAQKDAVLTSIDPDADHLHAARAAFKEASIASARTRLITGKAQEVLRRLTTGAYDLVFLDADKENLALYTDQALRLLRTGGMLIINDALDDDRVPRPAIREEPTQTLRQIERRLAEDEGVSSALFGTGTGLLAAVKR